MLLTLLLGWMPVAAAANLEIVSLSEAADPIPAGGVIDYTLTIHNGGPEAVPNAVAAFDIPAGTSAINLPSYCSVDPVVSTRVVCVIPQPLANDDSFSIDLQVSTAGLGPSIIDITAAVGRQPAPAAGVPLGSLPANDPFFAGDPNVNDNRATQNTTLIQAGDLGLTKTATPNPVVAGSEVTYTITVTNAGPSVSTNFNVADTLPSGVTFVPGSAQSVTGSWTFSGQNGTHAGALGVGQSASYTFRGKVNVASGSVVNTAVVNAVGTPDPNPGNNSDDVAVTIAAGADLAIGKTASPVPGLPGELITFTVTVTNNGPSPAEGVSWSDPMPAGFLIESASTLPGWNCATTNANTVRTCSLPAPTTLAVGASATFTVEARVPLTGPGSSGSITNTATVAGSLPDPNSSNNNGTANFTVLPNGADLSLSKSKAPQLVPTWPGPGVPPAGSGYIITSTITVKNEGPAEATSGVQVVDVLAVGEEYFPSNTAPWTCTATPYVSGAQQTVTCDFTGPYPLAMGQSAAPLKLLSFAHPEAEGSTLTNQACTGGSGGSTGPGTGSGLGDPNGNNNCNGAGITPSPLRADLSVSKRTNGPGDADNTLPIGYTGMSYTITVRNAGPDATRGVVIEDTLPGFLQGITAGSAVAPPGWSCLVSASGTLHCESGATALLANTPVDIVVNLTGLLADSASNPAAACGAVQAPAGAWCNTAGAGIDPSVAGAAGEINPGNNTGSDYVRVPRVSNVKTEAKKITSGDPAQVGVDTVYRIEYRNEGPSLAPGVVFRDVINLRADDPGFTLVNDIRSGGGTSLCVPTVTGGVTLSPGSGGLQNVTSRGGPAGTLVLTCAPLDIPGGQQQTMTVVIRPLDEPIVGGGLRVYNNTADFYFDFDGDGVPDPSGGTDGKGDYQYNNIANSADDEKSATVAVGDGDIDLVINKDDTGFTGGVDPLPYDPNDPTANFINYRVTVQNLGPSVASNVTITDTITPEAGKTLRFIGSSPSPGGPFTTIRCPVTAGANPTTGSSLTVECEVPGAGFPGIEVNGLIAAGATTTLYLRYQYLSQPGAGGDTINNVAVASGAEPETNLANNTEGETTAIRSKVDLAISKRAVSRLTPPSPDPSVALPPVLASVSIREPFFWVFDVENNGPGNSLSRDRTGSSPLNGTGTVITDTLPANMVVTGAPIAWQKVGPDIATLPDDRPNGTGSCTQSGQNVTCNVGDVTSEGASHGRVRVIIPVRWDVLPPGGNAINTVAVGTEQVDTNPANNTATAPINVTASTLAGTVFQDRDRSGSNGGVPQAAAVEPRIGNVTLALSGTDEYGNAVSLSTTTDANGDYSFGNLSPSNGSGYSILQTQPMGFANGPVDPPSSGPLAPSLGGVYAVGAPNSSYSAIPVPVNSNGVRYNFPEFNNARLAGFVYVDADFNNLRTAGSDPAIVGATVELLDAATSAVVQTTTTDASGAYQFIDLDPSRIYTLREPLPAGMYRNRSTAVNPGTVNGAACTSGCVAGTAVAGDPSTTDRISQIDLSIGIGTSEGLNFNFGEEPIGASLAGKVWLDANNNGIIDNGETGIAGVSISLGGTDLNNATVALGQTTDANGAYLFAGLLPGTYTVTEPDQPADTLNGITVAGSSGGTVTAVGVTPSVISAIVLAVDETSIDNNFGEIAISSIAGRVYYDNNKNGIIDAGESGIANVTLQLTGNDDLPNARAIVPPRSVVTDASGAYLFDNLRPGTYTVTEPNQPPDTTNGITTPGTVNGTSMGVATPVSTVPSAISAITLTLGQKSIEQNFGEVADTPDLVVSKSADPTRFTVNNAATYTVRVRNIGPQPTRLAAIRWMTVCRPA